MKKYKRLTERVGKGISVKETSTSDNRSIWNAIERLALLEDKIENGTLIELPCKVGQDIYYITNKRKIVHRIAREYRYLVDLGWEITATLWESDRNGYLNLMTTIIHSEEIGKNAFFTKAEAEKKLEELKNENTRKQ